MASVGGNAFNDFTTDCQLATVKMWRVSVEMVGTVLGCSVLSRSAQH